MADTIFIDSGIPLAEILLEKYPDLKWSLNENDYSTLRVYNGEKPAFEDLVRYAAEVVAILDAEKVESAKVAALQAKYPLQKQIILCARGVVLGEIAPLNDMLDYLDAL